MHGIDQHGVKGVEIMIFLFIPRQSKASQEPISTRQAQSAKHVKSVH